MISGSTRFATEKAVFRPALWMSLLPGISEMQMNHGAIETSYKGYKFRSRLEARWAVFFDELGLEWKYEDQGYEVGEHRYLPDFYLPTKGYWCEVKGDPSGLQHDFHRMAAMLGETSPLPGWGRGSTGLILLGEVPQTNFGTLILHPRITYIDKALGISRDWVFFTTVKVGNTAIHHAGGQSAIETLLGVRREINLERSAADPGWIVAPKLLKTGGCFPAVDAAYAAARSARFEYGESGGRN